MKKPRRRNQGEFVAEASEFPTDQLVPVEAVRIDSATGRLQVVVRDADLDMLENPRKPARPRKANKHKSATKRKR